MKKILILVFCVVMLAACSQPKECDLCGEMKTGTKQMSFLGEKVTVCRDCRAELSEFI